MTNDGLFCCHRTWQPFHWRYPSIQALDALQYTHESIGVPLRRCHILFRTGFQKLFAWVYQQGESCGTFFHMLSCPC